MRSLSPAGRRTYRNIALGVALGLIVAMGALSILTGNWRFIGIAFPVAIYFMVTGLVAHAWTRSGKGHAT